MLPITFETKCWENDYRTVLNPVLLDERIRGCGHIFQFRRVILNNIVDMRDAIDRARACVNAGVIDDFVVAGDLAEEALKQFNLTKEGLGKGYVYSIAELVGIVTCPSRYLLHFSSDSFPVVGRAWGTWMRDAIPLLDAGVLVANPVWNNRVHEAKDESVCELYSWYVGYGFSDQCYLIDAFRFKYVNLNMRHPASERYPTYGGELFEKRVDSYMRCTRSPRITNKFASYWHVK